jgi:site-specific DNA recombinase
MTKRAAIYIRVSTAEQSDGVSPDEQELDCRQKAEEHGLTIAEVYCDIAKYRVRNRWVDPSGTRSDRPGLVTMLEDAKQGRFDVILAWREDRLYRGMRPMLTVLETIQEYKIDVILAKETFDAKMTPVKAWVAGLELEAIHERTAMGQRGRLRKGKGWGGQVRYGYTPTGNGDGYEVVEEEARWIRKIYDWYLAGVPLMTIRERLIEGGAPQKGGPSPARMQWGRHVIQKILAPKAAKEYALGIREVTFDGAVFSVAVPTILRPEQYQALVNKREENKKNPKGPLKYDYLIQGLVYCDCARKWGAYTRRCKTKSGSVSLWGEYRCTQPHGEQVHKDCPRTIRSAVADDYVWARLCEVIQQPEILINGAREYVDKLRKEFDSNQAERESLQNELDSLTMERQVVIAWARKGRISENDMEYQLTNLTLQEISLKKDLAALGNVIQLSQMAEWEEITRQHITDAQKGLEELNVEPQDDAERQRQFELKRDLVLSLVDKVHIGKDRKIEVTFKLDVLSIMAKHEQNVSIAALPRR